jgi:hypothetical protein
MEELEKEYYNYFKTTFEQTDALIEGAFKQEREHYKQKETRFPTEGWLHCQDTLLAIKWKYVATSENDGHYNVQLFMIQSKELNSNQKEVVLVNQITIQ